MVNFGNFSAKKNLLSLFISVKIKIHFHWRAQSLMIASTLITNAEVFAFIAALFFKLVNRKVLFRNIKDIRNC